MLSEIRQVEKDKYSLFSLTYGILKIKQATKYNKTGIRFRYREQTTGEQKGGGRERGKIGSIVVLVIQLCPTPCDPMDCSPSAYMSMEFSRQEYWSG